jgi:hypothetical protein
MVKLVQNQHESIIWVSGACLVIIMGIIYSDCTSFGTVTLTDKLLAVMLPKLNQRITQHLVISPN